MRRARTVLSLLATSLLLRPLPLPAQQPTFVEKVEVRAMDIDVAVTDRKGQPVKDLTREDFQVSIDGKAVPIDYFARIDEGAVHAPDLTTASPDLVLAEYEKGGAAYVPRHFLIFFDASNTPLTPRRKGTEALRNLVTKLGPSDDALVALFDTRLRLLTNWTSSKETLLAAIDKLEKSSASAINRQIRSRQTIQEIDRSRSLNTRLSLARFYGEETYQEERRLLSELQGAVALVASRPGKKVFLYASGGFEFQPGYAMSVYAAGGSAGSVFAPSQTEFRLASELERIVRRANASEVTFYAVDLRGLMAEGISAAEDDPLEHRPGVSFIAREDSQAGMTMLAVETGGLALVNSNDFEGGLARLYREASTYYTLGVNLKNVPSSDYRAVRVEVRRAGLVVRARRGYQVRTADERIADRVEAAVRTDLSYRDFPVSVRPLPQRRQKGDRIQPIEVVLAAKSLTLVPGQESTTAEAEFYLAAMSDRGDRSPINRDRQTFTLPNDALKGNPPLSVSYDLKMKKGNYEIVVNVRDTRSGQMGTGRVNVHVE